MSAVLPFPAREDRPPAAGAEPPVFAELAAATNYSFLRGASHPSDMIAHAVALGMAGIGIADRNTVAGVVRAHVALKDALAAMKEGIAEANAQAEAGEIPAAEEASPATEEETAPTETTTAAATGTAAATATGAAGEAAAQPDAFPFRLIVGARLVFADGTPDIVVYPATRRGWGRLTRLLTVGNLRAAKGDCILHFADLLEYCDDLLLIAMGGEADEDLLLRLAGARPGAVWLGATMPRGGRDHRRLAMLMALSERTGVPLLATNDALYATPADRPLHDIVTCIREGVTVASAGRLIAANAERHLKPPREMARLFRACPQALAATADLLSRIQFNLDQLRYEYPHEPVPDGWNPQDWLENLVMEAAYAKHPDGISPKMREVLNEEFALIRSCKFAYYFLTVHDIVKFARDQEPPILCQGRGSAANSLVCYLLDITPIDPVVNNLLFSRFLSEERGEPPDIDVDFEHERREEVMQYIYRRYGRHRAGIAATVIHYRPRSALREVGKALGLSEDVTARLADTSWGSYGGAVTDGRFAEAGFDVANPEMARLQALVGRLLEFPRHLSQHVGGFVLTEDRLDETVPIHNAAMEDRTFIEWDKDDIDALGLMKVDVLALGMLTCIRKAFDLMRLHGEGDLALDTVPDDDEPTYDMLCKGDSIGVFQVESRAQINMLPRLRPRELYDLVIQVAIVRPGPIEGDMVHPYLRRRSGEEEVTYPSPAPPYPADELFNVLNKTYGVPLFQEQAMKLAIVAAEFTADEANGLRRAMATFRNVGTIHKFREKMIGGMVRRGYEQEFAERCFKQIEGFGSYGFPESHAQSFAKLVYVSAWIKCHQPAVFACALLNSQPMGFYAPAQIVRDAREHGVEVRPVDINASDWDNSLERRGDGRLALRLGLRQIDGFRETWAEALAQARAAGPITGIEQLARRAELPAQALRLLADADACRSIALDRREALWEARRTPSRELPLFAAAAAREMAEEPDAALPAMPLVEHVMTDYQMTRLSLKDHPMRFLRDTFRAEGVLSCAQLATVKNGARARVAGVVLIRQRPGKGNAIFVTLEDETGIANVLIWARLFERYRRPVMAARLMEVEGEVQKSKEGVLHLMASRVIDRTPLLDGLAGDRPARIELAPGDVFAHPQVPRSHGHPRDVRILPKSRDFH